MPDPAGERVRLRPALVPGRERAGTAEGSAGCGAAYVGGGRARVNSAGSTGPVRESQAACAGDWGRGARWEVESLRWRPRVRRRQEAAWRTTTPSGPCGGAAALPPPRGAPAGPAVPARPGERGGIAPSVLAERSEVFVSAVEVPAARSEQRGPPAADGCRGHTCAGPGVAGVLHRALQRPGCRPEHRAPLPQRVPLRAPQRARTAKRVCSEMICYCRTCLWER